MCGPTVILLNFLQPTPLYFLNLYYTLKLIYKQFSTFINNLYINTISWKMKNDQYICYHKLRTWNISLTTYSITHSFIKNNQPYLLSPITYSKHIRYIYIYYIKWGLRTFSTHFMRTICDHLGRETFISRNVRIPILFTISWLMKHPTRCLTI